MFLGILRTGAIFFHDGKKLPTVKSSKSQFIKSYRSQKAQCCGSNKQLLEEFHGVPHTKNRGAQIVREKGMDARDRDNSNDPKKRLTDTQKQVSKDSLKKLPTF